MTELAERLVLASSLGPPQKAARNAVEELKNMRDELKSVEQHQNDLYSIRRELAAYLAPGTAQPKLQASTVSSELAASVRTAENTVQRRVVANIFGASLAQDSARPKSRGWAALRGEKSGDALPAAAPLWVCSPESGWHAHVGVAQLPSRPGTVGSVRTASESATAELTTPGTSIVPLVGRLYTTSEHPVLPAPSSPALTGSYGKQLPWRPLRYDFDGDRRWVRMKQPTLPPPKTPSGMTKRPSGRMASTKSLPQLLCSTYGSKVADVHLYTEYVPMNIPMSM